jgi:hypothetical protein
MTKRKNTTARRQDMPKWQRDVELDVMFMRDDAREHDGIAAVTFLGRTWANRGPAYWVKRLLAILLYLLVAAAVTAMAVGFGIGILHSGNPVIGTILFTLWLLTAVPGFAYGWRFMRRSATGFPRKNSFHGPAMGPGCLVVVIVPFVAGLCLAVLLSTLLPHFPGEAQAKSIRDDWLRGQPGRQS